MCISRIGPSSWHIKNVIIAVCLLPLPSINSAAAEEIGVPRILDGDTVQIASTKIRLLGIDAPETDQVCLDREGNKWSCGVSARDELMRHTGGSVWKCIGATKDRYLRLLARCTVNNEDVQQWMVRSGWALSFRKYSHVYDNDEMQARSERAGMWSGAFIAPWEWRGRSNGSTVLGALSVPVDAQRQLVSSVSAQRAPARDCTIKANFSRTGNCIYHLDGDRWYGRMNMGQPNKRWFCSKEEAEAAGCRPAKL